MKADQYVKLGGERVGGGWGLYGIDTACVQPLNEQFEGFSGDEVGGCLEDFKIVERFVEGVGGQAVAEIRRMVAE